MYGFSFSLTFCQLEPWFISYQPNRHQYLPELLGRSKYRLSPRDGVTQPLAAAVRPRRGVRGSGKDNKRPRSQRGHIK